MLRGDAVGIVDFAYSDVLARPPDAVGKAFWVDALRAPDALLVPDLWHALWTSDEAVRRRKLAAGPAPQPVPPNAVTQALQSVRGSAQAIIDKVDSI